MTRALTVALAVALAGCAAKTAPVDLAMKPNLEGDATVTATSVELNHETDGWIRVSFSADAMNADSGKVSVGSEELPTGTYTGARVGYVHTMMVAPAPAADATITRENKGENDPDATITRENKGEDDADATITRTPAPQPEEVKNEGVATSDSTFCIGKDGGEVVLKLAESEGKLMLKAKGPDCE